MLRGLLHTIMRSVTKRFETSRPAAHSGQGPIHLHKIQADLKAVILSSKINTAPFSFPVTKTGRLRAFRSTGLDCIFDLLLNWPGLIGFRFDSRFLLVCFFVHHFPVEVFSITITQFNHSIIALATPLRHERLWSYPHPHHAR